MNVIKISNNAKQKVKISKEDIEQAMKTCSTREQLANYFGVSLSTIKRRLKEFNLSTFKIISKYFLENWNIKVSFFKDRTMYIPSKFRDKFTLIIKPFIHSDCLYKLHPESF